MIGEHTSTSDTDNILAILGPKVPWLILYENLESWEFSTQDMSTRMV